MFTFKRWFQPDNIVHRVNVNIHAMDNVMGMEIGLLPPLLSRAVPVRGDASASVVASPERLLRNFLKA